MEEPCLNGCVAGDNLAANQVFRDLVALEESDLLDGVGRDCQALCRV